MAKATGFNERVYAAARQIPPGKVATYKALAAAAGNKAASRAVGRLMHINKAAISGVSCHRVIQSDGKLGGFAHGRKKKRLLLLSEGVVVRKGAIDLSKFAYKFK